MSCPASARCSARASSCSNSSSGGVRAWRAKNGPSVGSYPGSLDTPAKRALYDNLMSDEALALKVDGAVRGSLMDEWREHPVKTRKVKFAIKAALGGDEERTERTLDLVKSQHEY
jgi:type I restriction enzyme R subunit